MRRRPDEKGIKTRVVRRMIPRREMRRRPDEKGIKTTVGHDVVLVCEMRRRPDEKGIKTAQAGVATPAWDETQTR